MRKTVGLVSVIVLAMAATAALGLAAEEPDKKNLQGINYVGIMCRFNGVPFYKIYQSPLTEEPGEVGAEEAEKKFKEAGIPISKENIGAIYDIMESSFKKAELRIVAIKNNPDQGEATIIPTVSINIDVMGGSKELYFTLVHLTVSKWISTWSGTENIHTRMITWWQKRMLAAAPKELNETVRKAVKELIDDFIARLKEAN